MGIEASLMVKASVPAGSCSDVLETEHGFQIIHVREIIEKSTKTLEEAETEIQEKLFQEIVNQRFESWISDLKANSHIEVID